MTTCGPGWYSSVGWASFLYRKVDGSISCQGMCFGCGFNTPYWGREGSKFCSHINLSLSSPFLSF